MCGSSGRVDGAEYSLVPLNLDNLRIESIITTDLTRPSTNTGMKYTYKLDSWGKRYVEQVI